MDGPALRPWEIRKLTLSEIPLYLDGKDEAPEGTPVGSYGELLKVIAKRRAMTDQERFEEARREVHG